MMSLLKRLTGRNELYLDPETRVDFESTAIAAKGPLGRKLKGFAASYLQSTMDTPVPGGWRVISRHPNKPGRSTFYADISSVNAELCVQLGRALALTSFFTLDGVFNGAFCMSNGSNYRIEASARVQSDGRQIATLRRMLGGRWGNHPMQSNQIRWQNKDSRKGETWFPGWTKYHLTAKLQSGETIALVGSLGEPHVWIAEGFYREMLIRSGFDNKSFPALWG